MNRTPGYPPPGHPPRISPWHTQVSSPASPSLFFFSSIVFLSHSCFSLPPLSSVSLPFPLLILFPTSALSHSLSLFHSFPSPPSLPLVSLSPSLSLSPLISLSPLSPSLPLISLSPLSPLSFSLPLIFALPLSLFYSSHSPPLSTLFLSFTLPLISLSPSPLPRALCFSPLTLVSHSSTSPIHFYKAKLFRNGRNLFFPLLFFSLSLSPFLSSLPLVSYQNSSPTFPRIGPREHGLRLSTLLPPSVLCPPRSLRLFYLSLSLRAVSALSRPLSLSLSPSLSSLLISSPVSLSPTLGCSGEPVGGPALSLFTESRIRPPPLPLSLPVPPLSLCPVPGRALSLSPLRRCGARACVVSSSCLRALSSLPSCVVSLSPSPVCSLFSCPSPLSLSRLHPLSLSPPPLSLPSPGEREGERESLPACQLASRSPSLHQTARFVSSGRPCDPPPLLRTVFFLPPPPSPSPVTPTLPNPPSISPLPHQLSPPARPSPSPSPIPSFPSFITSLRPPLPPPPSSPILLPIISLPPPPPLLPHLPPFSQVHPRRNRDFHAHSRLL
ncbi:hypothetical protein C7M84_011019 [Penaeus vannamei]|uniref:Uncharacterized protein n=1 Tax=Penaeus vannamei TaxID=6689 RepID=A0A423T2H8_PENVA|nr:hypothetical protein C7M84_011019 [Penaeus vannamei]